MAFNGSGNFSRSYNWVTDRNNGIKILAERRDGEDDGFATGLSLTICNDGQSTCTARIPFAQGLSVGLGSVGTPSISPVGDTNTGIYATGADAMAGAAGGSQIFAWTTAGFSITGTLAVSSDFAINTNKFTVAGSSGNTVVAGTLLVTGATTHSAAITYGGVTLTNAVTGTGSMVLSASPALTGTPTSGGSAILTLAGNATLTGGFNATSFSAGTKSSGTFIPAPLSSNHQHYTNGGAHTLAPPATTCSMVIEITNNGGAGAITTSGFTKVDGDAFTTTNGHVFICYIAFTNGSKSHLNVKAMQ